MIAKTPTPPYYAVVFTSVRTSVDEGYYATNDKLVEMVKQVPGYLGHESAREEIGITVVYFDSLEASKNWKMQPDHKTAQQNGRDKWYSAYKVRVCKVERDYGFEKE